jgi:DNA-binding MarR family transcriptional regulator
VIGAGRGDRRNGAGEAPRRRARRWSPDARRLLGLLNALGTTTFRQLLWQKATELDLTFAQSQVLAYLERHPGCHMGEVAKTFGVTLPAATHIVDRLEQKGLVGRGVGPGDRRVCVLELSAAGAVLVEELEALQLGALEPVLDRLGPGGRRRVLGALEALVEAGEEVARPAPARAEDG